MSNNQKIQNRKFPLVLRWAWLFWLAFFMIWLRAEDVDLIFVTLLALTASSLILFSYTAAKEFKQTLPAYLLSGLIAGFLVTPLILSLIVFKSSLHAHGFFELPTGQINDILINTILWLSIGPYISYAIFRRKNAPLR
ncbi:MAG: hypothetical protein HON98_02660 [Chloroflexi bacterium]|jgi:hypothetical protein|nr:hypothetical protein [Chloroflexota bacterium]MBT3668744.1 hypothetical protein [Chloroflexota bacterium]MBT4001910.1 hypothetical protein [Chloroflexota bacterium]MBT4305445.1 hypothetical protein [Chloroflexota bacterium]MBT4533056.1 hypothetical protein [Chloroflexota bacterium]